MDNVLVVVGFLACYVGGEKLARWGKCKCVNDTGMVLDG